MRTTLLLPVSHVVTSVQDNCGEGHVGRKEKINLCINLRYCLDIQMAMLKENTFVKSRQMFRKVVRVVKESLVY